LRILAQMGVQESIDAAYTPHGNHEGLSVGWLAVIWLTYIVSACDHRMATVQEWVMARREALEQLIGQPLRETDFTDDRLADVLRYLSQDAVWHLIEAAISARTIRVYHLEPTTVRLDPTVGQVYHDADEHTLFKVGRTKDDTYAVQFKLVLAAMDPLGLPLAVDVVSGDRGRRSAVRAHLPTSSPDLGPQRVAVHLRQRRGAPVETRATMQWGGDFYLVPLAMVGDTPALLEEQLTRLWAGEVALTQVYLPQKPAGRPGAGARPRLGTGAGL